MQTTRFLITGVGGQGTILASDVLAEVGLRLGYDAKKSDILGLAVRGGSVVSHIIWSGKVRAPMIDEGSADYYISFEWLEGLRRMAYTNPDTVILANDWRIDPVAVSSGQAEYPPWRASGTPCGNAAPRSTSSPPPPWPWIWATPVYSTASSWASCPCSWAGTGTSGAPPWRTPSPPRYAT